MNFKKNRFMWKNFEMFISMRGENIYAMRHLYVNLIYGGCYYSEQKYFRQMGKYPDIQTNFYY